MCPVIAGQILPLKLRDHHATTTRPPRIHSKSVAQTTRPPRIHSKSVYDAVSKANEIANELNDVGGIDGSHGDEWMTWRRRLQGRGLVMGLLHSYGSLSHQAPGKAPEFRAASMGSVRFKSKSRITQEELDAKSLRNSGVAKSLIRVPS